MRKTKARRSSKINSQSTYGSVKNKVVLIGVGLLIIAIGILIIIRFSSPEDTWLCTENGWIKHGNPRTEMPKDGCVAPSPTQ